MCDVYGKAKTLKTKAFSNSVAKAEAIKFQQFDSLYDRA